MSARIRKATPEDLPALLEIYEKARAYMARTGNPRQWGSTNPPRKLLEDDIRLGFLYLHETDTGRPYGAFTLLPGADPTYGRIEGGAWRSDAPYCTIPAWRPTGADGASLPGPWPSAWLSAPICASIPMRTTGSCKSW